MGYRAWIDDAKFTIPADKVEAALASVMTAKGSYKTPVKEAEGIKDFQYLPAFRKLEEVVRKTWGVVLKMGENNAFVTASYDWEKATGAELELSEKLAPFVEGEGYIEWCGEDGSRWRHVFKDGKVTEKHPKISWE